MRPADLSWLQALLLRRAGIKLWSEKRYVAEVRLQGLAQAKGHENAAGLLTSLRVNPDPETEALVVEAMATHETLFFRDRKPFEQIEQVILPALLQARARTRRIRIWCCAVSTGQEAYSIALLLARHKDLLKGWSVDILGTDLSRPAIERARAGVYSHFEVQRGLPIRELIEHFTRDGEDWTLSPEIRRAVTFDVVNIVHETVTGPFDLVLCRNLMIYLDAPVKTVVFDRIARVLAPDGYLILGATESVVGATTAIVPHPQHHGLYRTAEPLGSSVRGVVTEPRRTALSA